MLYITFKYFADPVILKKVLIIRIIGGKAKRKLKSLRKVGNPKAGEML